MLKSVGGYHSQFTDKIYNYWLKNYDKNFKKNFYKRINTFVNSKDLIASKKDSLFRLRVEEKSSFGIIKTPLANSIYFFPPVSGEVTDSYSFQEGHFGVDVATKKNEVIKSVLDGRIVISNWTLKTGFVIGVYHSNGFLSIYKHNSSLLKEIGDVVKRGESIAVVGNSGELTTGPHLHFELWKNGESVNPLDYISF